MTLQPIPVSDEMVEQWLRDRNVTGPFDADDLDAMRVDIARLAVLEALAADRTLIESGQQDRWLAAAAEILAEKFEGAPRRRPHQPFQIEA